MADYYPLIARAVTALKDARAEERAPVYERARNALINHLKAIQPPVAPDVLEAEEQALDEAIARVEAEILSGDTPGQEASQPPAPRPQVAPVVAPAGSAPAHLPQVDDAPPVVSTVRPPAPPPRTSAPQAPAMNRHRAIVLACIAGVAALAVAALAYATRTDPARIVQPEPPTTMAQPAQQPEAAPGKAGDRVGDAGSATSAPPSGPGTSAPTPPPLPVAQRAIMYEEQPETPGKPAEITGRAVWRLDTVNVGAGQPPETVVRIDLDFPERSFATEITIRRNLEPALSASHLMEIRFVFRAGGGSVKDLATPPQMKQEENQRGTPLIALQVPVMDNFFLVGLSKLPADVERNVSLLEGANWIDLPVRFANGRLAVIAFEKGTNGNDVLNAALVRWRS